MATFASLEDALVFDIFVRSTRGGLDGVGDEADVGDARAETYGESEAALDLALSRRYRALAIAAALRTIRVGSSTQMAALLEHLRQQPDACAHIRGITLSYQFAGSPRPSMTQVAALLRLASCAVSIHLDLPGSELVDLVAALGDSLQGSRIRYLGVITTSWTRAPASLSRAILALVGMVGRTLRWLELDSDGPDMRPVGGLELPTLRGLTCRTVSSVALAIINASPQLRALTFTARPELRNELCHLVDGVEADAARSILSLHLATERRNDEMPASYAALTSLILIDLPDLSCIDEWPPSLEHLVLPRCSVLDLATLAILVAREDQLRHLRRFAFAYKPPPGGWSAKRTSKKMDDMAANLASASNPPGLLLQRLGAWCGHRIALRQG